MLEKVHEWTRFWCPYPGRVPFAYDGFLADPSEQSSCLGNSELVTLEQLTSSQVLILLGEPGLGKSQALEDSHSTIEAKVKANGHKTLFLDLAGCDDSYRLDKELFLHPAIAEWQRSDYHLYLLLDSFDECFLGIENLAYIFSKELRKYEDQSDRLHLWITCRTAVWPSFLEEDFEKIWSKEKVKTYQLAPLRREDVRRAVEVSGNICADSFLKEIQEKRLTSLAIKPITLKFLISVHGKQGQKLLENQKLHELYFEGCRALCKEIKDKKRHRQRSISKLSEDQKTVVAARIAAMMMFSNHSSIYIGELPTSLEKDIIFRDICEGYETAQSRRFEISKEVVWEVINTGLFASKGADYIGYAHRTYAEFLSAWYLSEHRVSKPDIMDLIVHPSETDSRIIPQLYETTSWIASTNDEIFHEVLRTDPDVLIRSDLLSTQDIRTKELFVRSMLDLCDKGDLGYTYRYRAYRSLTYPGLSQQLSSYIANKKANTYARYLAMDIAEDCHLEAVHPLLAKVALDDAQPYVLRFRAARIVADSASSVERIKLKPLVFSTREQDPEDELRGYALQAVYPDHMTTQELLDCLSSPRRNGIIGGAYQDFIAKELPQRVPSSDLAITLQWLMDLPPYRDLSYPFSCLSDRLLTRAWACLDDALILKAFAKVAAQRLQQYSEVVGQSSSNISFAELLEEDTTKRRRLLEATIREIGDTRQAYCISGVSDYSALHPLKADFDWIVSQSVSANAELEREIYAYIVIRRLDWSNTSEIETVLTNVSKSPALRKEFSFFLDDISLDSPEAEQARKNYYEEQRWVKARRPVSHDPLLKRGVLSCLDQFEQGDTDEWCRLYKLLLTLPGNKRYSERWNVDITTFYGWKDADADTRSRIVSAAKEYILKGDPQNNSWLGQGTVTHSAVGGYRALRLIAVKDRDFLLGLADSIWQKWVGTILGYPVVDRDPDQDIRSFILKEAYARASQEFIRVLDVIIDGENARDVHIYKHIEAAEQLWDKQIESYLVKKIADKGLTKDNFGYVLTSLLIRKVKSARSLAESYLSVPVPHSQILRDKLMMSAKCLLLHTDDAAWSVVWKVIQHDTTTGKNILESVATHAAYDGRIDNKLTEADIADLYIFLYRNYPDRSDETDSEHKGLNGPEARLIMPVDNIKTWRDWLPQRLQTRGTHEACSALRKIMSLLPENKEAIQGRLPEAETLARSQSWRPPSPAAVLRLIVREEPSMSDLSKQMNNTEENLQREISENPRVSVGDNNRNIAINSGEQGIVHQQVNPTEKRRPTKIDWIGILGILVGLLSVAFSGIFNDFWPRATPSVEQVEESSESKSVDTE